MLGYYERGDRTPDALALTEFRLRHGISLTWLITGEGAMFDDPSKEPPPSTPVVPELLERLQRAARRAYKAVGQTAPDDRLAVEAAHLYNALLSRVTDLRDAAIVDAVIPILVRELEERLKQAEAEPGTGKRSA